MDMLTVSPSELEPNPWNSNTMTPDMEMKLEASLLRHGMFKPVLVRTLPDGRRQILGGQHRAMVAARIGMDVPAINLGEVPDARAKEIGLIDNGRYGHDQADLLAKLLEGMGDPKELSSFLPFDLAEIDAMSAVSRIDLDSLGLEDEDAPPEPKPTRAAKTHATLKFKVPVADQHVIEEQIEAVIADQGLDDSDSAVNAGDALLWLIRAYQGDK